MVKIHEVDGDKKKQRELIKEIIQADEKDGLYDDWDKKELKQNNNKKNMEFQEATGSLNMEESINKTTQEEIFYFIDFSKLKNVEDLVTVMAAMGFGLSNKHFHFEKIKHFLDLDRPVRAQ